MGPGSCLIMLGKVYLVNLEEKKELVVEAYQRSFDLDLSYLKSGINDDERKLLNQDSDFQERLQYFLIEEKERIFSTLRALILCGDDKTALKATIELGKMIYPNRFVEGYDEKTGEKRLGTIKHDLEIIHNDTIAEVLKVLDECGALAPRIVQDDSAEADEIYPAQTGT